MHSRKTVRLKELLKGLQPGLLAVSGGVDSRFLAQLIAQWELDFRPVFFAGPHMSRAETEQALAFLNGLGPDFDCLPLDPLEIAEVRENTRQRCYFCKRFLFARTREHGRRLGRRQILEGSHLSDRDVFRPGLQALRELGIHSPLADSGYTKTDIRTQAAAIGLKQPEQPSKPCLLTRFAYGCVPTGEDLSQVGRAEEHLENLGLRDFRIRVLGREKIVLQLTPSGEPLYASRRQRVLEAMAAHGLEAFSVHRTERLSGFFD